MPPPEDAAIPPDRRAERLEPTTVGTGRILIVVAALVALLLGALGGMFWAYGRVARRSEAVDVLRFPEPRLEANIDPRATAGSGHGPRPAIRPPPVARAQELAPAPDRLRAAMDAVAARGPAAYDPPPEAGR